MIATIAHAEQRYNTVGDWTHDGETVVIRVSDLGDWKFNFLVALHELVEWAVCKDKCVAETDVDRFDMAYAGSCDEPGDDIDAPYWFGHQVASGIERTASAALGVDWHVYEKAVTGL